MIVYLDASALVKRYVAETGSVEVETLIGQAEVVSTSLISRAEVSAALAKAVRMNWLALDEGEKALQVFRAQWADIVGIEITETVVVKADSLAWEQGLRGYGAVHLASALIWQETFGEPVILATFDEALWSAAHNVGLTVWPQVL